VPDSPTAAYRGLLATVAVRPEPAPAVKAYAVEPAKAAPAAKAATTIPATAPAAKPATAATGGGVQLPATLM